MIRLVVEIDPSALPPESAEAMRRTLLAVAMLTGVSVVVAEARPPEPPLPPACPVAVCNVTPGCTAATPCARCRQFLAPAGIEAENVTAPAESNSAPTGAVHLARPGLGSTYCDRPLPGDTDLWTYRTDTGTRASCAECVDAFAAARAMADFAIAPGRRNPLVRGPRNCGCRARGPHRRACPEAA